MKLAPITLFVYNRLWHTKQTVEALLKNDLASKSDLIIYSDGNKTEQDEKSVQEVRDYIKGIEGFKSLSIIEREKNFGLAKSIIEGVTEVVGRYQSIIVLEDDMVVSNYFLQFMNHSLSKYEIEERVACIHAWNFPLRGKLPETFFLRGGDCWGWATWKHGWDLFEANGQKLLLELEMQNLKYEFDLDEAYPYFQMLKDQIEGKNNSWAIRWHASLFLKNKLTLYPGESLLQNIGLDNSGTHIGDGTNLKTNISKKSNLKFPRKVEIDSGVRKKIIQYLKPDNRSIIKKIKDFLNESLRSRLTFLRDKK